ncbi:MAG: hypothetical protein V3W18_04465 [candidate division Zixibacteria bacterium]
MKLLITVLGLIFVTVSIHASDDIKALENKVIENPHDFESVSELARIYIAQENYQPAEAILKNYLSYDSLNVDVLYLYGRVLDFSDNILEAMGYYMMTIEKDSSYWQAFRDLALVYDIFADYESMNRFMIDAFKQTPFPESLYYEMGYSYDMLELPDSALIYYQAAVEFDSTDSFALMNLGAIWGYIGEVDSASFYTGKSVFLNPESPGANFNYAEIMTMTGDTLEAISYFSKAIALESNLYGANKRLGEIFEARGDSAMARIYFEEFLKFAPLIYAEEINEVKAKLSRYR